MDQTNLVIKKVRALEIPKVEIETSESKRYVADLSDFKNVYCFPKNQQEWNELSITASGSNLTWGTRFEVHVDQIIDSAEIATKIKLHG